MRARRPVGAALAVFVGIGAASCSSRSADKPAPAPPARPASPAAHDTDAPAAAPRAASLGSRVWVVTAVRSGYPQLVDVTLGVPHLAPDTLYEPQPNVTTVSPDGSSAYVITEADQVNDVRGHIYTLDLDTGTVTGDQIVSDSGDDYDPGAVAYEANGSTAYIATADGILTPLDLRTGRAGTSIPVDTTAACGDAVSHLVLTSDGSTGLHGVPRHSRRRRPGGAPIDPHLHGPRASAGLRLRRPRHRHHPRRPHPVRPAVGIARRRVDADRHRVRQGRSDHRDPDARQARAPSDDQFSLSWDAVDVPTNGTALVVDYGARPETVTAVNLRTGVVGAPVAVSPAPGPDSSCDDPIPDPVALSADGTTAIVGDPASRSVYEVDLRSGRRGPTLATDIDPASVIMSRGWPVSTSTP